MHFSQGPRFRGMSGASREGRARAPAAPRGGAELAGVGEGHGHGHEEAADGRDRRAGAAAWRPRVTLREAHGAAAGGEGRCCACDRRPDASWNGTRRAGEGREKTRTERNPRGHFSLGKQADLSARCLSGGSESARSLQEAGRGLSGVGDICSPPRSLCPSPPGSHVAAPVSPREDNQRFGSDVRARCPGRGIGVPSAPWEGHKGDPPSIRLFRMSPAGGSGPAGRAEARHTTHRPAPLPARRSLLTSPVLALLLLKRIYVSDVTGTHTLPARHKHGLP